MLPEQDSATNRTASPTFADPMFDSFLDNDTTLPINYPLQDPIKTEQDDTTYLGYQQILQHMRREAQQQYIPMARPGQQNFNQPDLHDKTSRKTFATAQAVEPTRTVTLSQTTEVEPKRPCTPRRQVNNCTSWHARIKAYLAANVVLGQFPMTPETSPHAVGNWSRDMPRSRTAESSPTRSNWCGVSNDNALGSAEAMRRTSSSPEKKLCLEDELQNLLRCTEQSPPASAGLFAPPSFAHFPDVPAMNTEFAVKGPEYDPSLYSPMSSALTPLMSSFESSPEMSNMSLFDSVTTLPDLSLPSRAAKLPISQNKSGATAYPSPPKEKSHRRTQSAVTADLDGINEDTGVTEDEITMYMVGPNQENKYMCTYEGCNKLFGRKENIRSHVQTHLGDRQWRCSHCHKRFVRHHDLKRHSKIHTGQKPHLCPCGNGFARHDALTRHRQRNTCIGGFGVVEGMPQSPSKRGRPRKRPDLDSRREKAARTRERVLEKATASSVSGSSDFSAPSPEMFFEEMTTGSSQADDMVMIQSQETDEMLEAVNAMSPEMVEECLREMSKSSSPFSDFEENNLFGSSNTAFDTTYDSTSAWLL
ncbi:MAG: hypothetical protein Q9174_000775 [Haloplaca sp. 1 TL-2023]